MTLHKAVEVRGVGIDIEEVDRFRKILKSEKRKAFLERIFTPREIAYCENFKDSASHFAAHFAAKEAVVKAMSGRVASLNVEIRHLPSGAPQVYIQGQRSARFSVSITHTTATACAVALYVQ